MTKPIILHIEKQLAKLATSTTDEPTFVVRYLVLGITRASCCYFADSGSANSSPCGCGLSVASGGSLRTVSKNSRLLPGALCKIMSRIPVPKAYGMAVL